FRRLRQWVIVLVMLILVFAQIVTAAHACTLATLALQAVASGQSGDNDMSSDCPAMAKHAAANAKLCESHCAYGQQIDVQLDAPVATIAPQPALTVRILTSIVPRSLGTASLHARSTAPPLSLLFGRFLI